MTEIMSLDEMDALLASISGEESPKREQTVRPLIIDGVEARTRIYDFRRPVFMPSIAESRVKEIVISACDDIEVLLGAQTGIALDRGSIGITQLSCGEALRSFTAPTLMSLVDVDPLLGPMVIEVMPGLAYALIDRLGGGAIRDVSLNPGITADEARAAVTPLGLIAGAICDSLANGELVPRVKAVYSDPMKAKIRHHDEMGLLATIDAAIEHVEGIISVLFPRIFFWPVFASLSGPARQSAYRTIPVIDFPLKVRAASYARIQKLGPSSRLEIDTSAAPRADMNAPSGGN